MGSCKAEDDYNAKEPCGNPVKTSVPDHTTPQCTMCFVILDVFQRIVCLDDYSLCASWLDYSTESLAR
jgi:hypothetical protein